MPHTPPPDRAPGTGVPSWQHPAPSASEQAWSAGGPSSGPPAPAPGSIDDSFAWTLTLTPILWLLLDAAFLAVGLHIGGAAAAAFAVGAVLVVQDCRTLSRAGVRLSYWWGILLTPLHLILRTRRARSPVAMPILWGVLAVGYVFGSGPALSAVGVEQPAGSYGCAELADDAVAVSADTAAQGDAVLLKVRAPRRVVDHRDDYTLPDGAGESLVLACLGTGVWSDGGPTSQVRIELTVDADGDEWIAYRTVS